MISLRRSIACVVAGTPTWASAAESFSQTQTSVGSAGVSGIWVLANISFAGMRAQNSPSDGWRFIAFLLGFPGTLITFFAVDEGAERAYGIDLPRKR
ncbi:MAG: hypothetical protein ABI885_29290 [Gammaproteobacteria bacterium]